MALHLHIYQHFSIPIARHTDYAFLISYFLNNPLPELKSANDPREWIQLPLTVRQGTSVHSRRIFSKIIILTIDNHN